MRKLILPGLIILGCSFAAACGGNLGTGPPRSASTQAGSQQYDVPPVSELMLPDHIHLVPFVTARDGSYAVLPHAGQARTLSGGSYASFMNFQGYQSGMGEWHYAGIDPSCGSLNWTFTLSIPDETLSWTGNPVVNTTLTGSTPWQQLATASNSTLGVYNGSVGATCTNPNHTGNAPWPTTFTVGVVQGNIVDLKPATPVSITSTTVPRVIGQHISLGIQVLPTSAPSPAAIQWSPPPGRVALYPYVAGTTPSPLPTVLASPSVDFYWYQNPEISASSTPVPISASIEEVGSLSNFQAYATPEANISVQSPSGVTMSAPVSASNVLVGPYGSPPPIIALSLGDYASGDTVGVNFSISLTAPQSAGGVFAGQQFISQTVTLNGTPTSGSGLDNCQLYGAPQGVAAGKQATWKGFNDSPAIGLANLTGSSPVSLSDSFKLYTVFKPNPSAGAADSMYVTMAVIPWSFSGTAVYANKTWSLKSGSNSASTGTVAPSYGLNFWPPVFGNSGGPPTSCPKP